MSRALCPKCGFPPTRHNSQEELIEHLVECQMFISYVKHLTETRKVRKGSRRK